MYKQPYSLSSSQRAFTLIELSIVLVIIGLIVGGVLVGRDLIQAAKIRQTVSQVTEFKTAANTFRIKYNCLPGDCTNATNYFPVWNGTTGAINGDGNGQIGLYNTTDTNLYPEPFQAWHQMGAAGLVKGNYKGLYGPVSVAEAVPCMNVPASALGDNIGYFLAYTDAFTHPTDFSPCVFCKITGHMIMLGASDANSIFDGRETYIPAFSPAIAYAIDSKIDDGYPGRGTVFTYAPTNNFVPYFGLCTSTTDPATATYVLSNNASSCNLVFTNLGF